ncbi:MAG: archaellar assembly protein FlaJ [Archaeoglobales archaeon]|nr:archaellar assembly protein FlaJ [Archaeoglobales archaeon]
MEVKEKFALKGAKIEFNFFKKLAEKIRHLSENSLMDNDLLFTLTYMASLSTAKLSRDKIFEMVSERDYLPSKYFRKIKDLTQKWHYDYATACSLMADKVRHERLKSLFNRLANAISAGEPDEEFLAREWKHFKTVRKDEYERSLESLRKWTDAYVSLLVSASLISIVILLSVIIYSPGDAAATLYGAVLANVFICGFGVFMLWRAVPKDKKVHNYYIKSKEQVLVSKLSKIIIPLGILVLVAFVIVPTLLGGFSITGNVLISIKELRGYGFVFAGLLLLPIAIIAKIDDSKISGRDEAFTSFIRSLGAIKSGAGVSIAEAISRIDEKNLGALKDLVAQLYRRLSLGLDAKLSWARFIGESGSYLIHKFTNIFLDATDLGGDADVVGEIVSSSNLEMVLLRLKRNLISSGFINLLIPLHLSMVGLIIFITEIMNIFTSYITQLFETQIGGNLGGIMSNLPGGLSGMNIGIFSAIPFELMNQFTVFSILSLTIANTIAANIVKGSGVYMYVFYGSIFALLSGVLLLVIPPLVEWLFSFPSFVE